MALDSRSQKSWCSKKTEFIFDAGLLFLSFLIQVVGKILPPETVSAVTTSLQLYGAALGFGGPTLALVLLYIPYRLHRRKAVRDFEQAVKGKV